MSNQHGTLFGLESSTQRATARNNSNRASESGRVSSTSNPLLESNGTKRTASGTVKPTEDKNSLVKKLVSDMRIYTYNVISNATEIMRREPEKTYHCSLTIYNAKKMAATREMLESVLTAEPSPATAPQPAPTPEHTPSKIDATEQIEKIVRREMTNEREKLVVELSEEVSEHMYEQIARTVETAVEYSGRELMAEAREELRKEFMDDDMVQVKESILLEIKARKELGDASDTQDQLRNLGDLLS